MNFKLGRRAPLYLAVALIAGLMAAQPTLSAAEWQNPARHLTVTDADGGSLRPGDTVQAALSGFAPQADVQLAICYDSLFSFGGARPPSDGACTPRTSVAADQSGSATVGYQIPANLGASLAGNCSLGLFGSFTPCSLVAFEGAPKVSVTNASVRFANGGTASVSGRVVDDLTGAPLAVGFVELCRDFGYDCITANASSGIYQFSSLPAGTYSVRASASTGSGVSFPDGSGVSFPDGSGVSFPDGSGVSFPDGSGVSFPDGSGVSFPDGSGVSFPDGSGVSFPDGSGVSFPDGSGVSFPDGSGVSFPDGSGVSFPDGSGLSFGDGFSGYTSNVVGVTVAEGQAISDLDVPVPAPKATTGPVGRSGATMSVTPANPAWNDVVTISGGGFRPGHEVNVGLCSPMSIAVVAGHLATCLGTTVTADASGNATAAIPYTAARFRDTCPPMNACVAVAHETDVDGSGRWASLGFTPPTGTATISGNVTLGGVPLASNNFLSVNACGPVGCTLLIPNESAFRASAPADGEYTITASARVGGRSVNGSKTVTVSGDQSVTGIDVALDVSGLPTGAISGVVKDSTGDVIPGVTVSACPTDVGPCFGTVSATADGQGNYRLPYLGDGTWRLTVTSSDFSVPFSFAQLATVSGGGETTGVDLALPVDLGTGSIEVDIVDVNGQPIDGAVFTCYQSGSGGDCRNALSTNGTATLRFLPDGTYQIQGSAGGTFASVSATVTGGGTSRVSLTMPLAPGAGSIAGSVRDAGGDPLMFASVSVCAEQPAGGCSTSYHTVSQPDGKYQRTDLPDGTYRVTASGLNSNQVASTTVVVSAAADVTGVDLTIPVDFGTGTIEGAVTDPNGIGIQSQVQACNGAVCFGQTMSGPGTYQIQNLPDGTYTVTARGFQNPFITSTRNGVVVADGKATKGIDFQLDTSGPPPIDGTAPTATATITPEPNAAGWVASTATVKLEAADEEHGSGLASLSLGDLSATEGPLSSDVSTDGTTTLSYAATDHAGNVQSGTVTVNVDRTAPTASITAPAAGASVPQGAAVAASYECADATSGIASCTGSVPNGSPIDTSTPGTKTLTVTATDNAGNTTTETRTLIVTGVTPPASGDQVSVRFSGAVAANYDADLTGQVALTRVKGKITAATASGTVPGAAGGTATVEISVRRVWNTSLFLGRITVTDPSQGLSVSGPILGNVTTSGSTVSGTSRWFTSKLAPYTVKWAITDGG